MATTPTTPRDAPAPAASLVLRGIARAFPGRMLFAGLDLACDGPGVVGIAGRNGSGKTSLLRMVAQLLEPTAGTIELCGRVVDGDDTDARRLVAYVAHQPAARRSRSVRDNLAFEARLRGVPRRDVGALVDDLLEHWELASQAGQAVAVLSRGQLQRLSLALAETASAPVILLDEPTVALDAAGRSLLETAIESWRADHVVVVASHELEWLERRSDVVLELEVHA